MSPLLMSSLKMSPVALRRPLKSTDRPSGEMFGDSGLSTRLQREPVLDIAGQHVLDDQRLVLLVAHEIGEAIADRRPRHPRHHVAETRLRDVLEAAILVEAGRQVAHDRPVLRREQDDVELLIAAVAGHDGDEIARRRRLDRDRARVVRPFRIGGEILAVVGRPLLVAERLESIFQIFLELLVELARGHLERFFVRARAAADGALAQREEELPDAVLAPARFDELVERVAEVIDQPRAAEVAVAFHLAHARNDVGDRGVADGHEIERIPDAALVFGAAFVHPQRDVAPQQRHGNEVVLKDVRQLMDDQAVEQVRRQIDRQHHAVALAFGKREHAFLRGARRDVLLLELAVRLEDDEGHALVEVVPQV